MAPTKFLCKQDYKLAYSYVCDGYMDCVDSSYEESCPPASDPGYLFPTEEENSIIKNTTTIILKSFPNISAIIGGSLGGLGGLALITLICWITITKHWPVIIMFLNSCLDPVLTLISSLSIPTGLYNTLNTILATPPTPRPRKSPTLMLARVMWLAPRRLWWLRRLRWLRRLLARRLWLETGQRTLGK